MSSLPNEDTPASPEGRRVELLTRSRCHLCDEARAVVARVAAEYGCAWSERSVEDEPELLARFSEEIPVLFIDGVQRDFWTIDEVRLRRLLAG